MAKKQNVRDLLSRIAQSEQGLAELDAIMFSRRTVQMLINLRREAGLTQEALAEEAVISLGRVKEIETDPFVEVRVSTIARWARACGAEIDLHAYAIPSEPEPEEA